MNFGWSLLLGCSIPLGSFLSGLLFFIPLIQATAWLFANLPGDGVWVECFKGCVRCQQPLEYFLAFAMLAREMQQALGLLEVECGGKICRWVFETSPALGIISGIAALTFERCSKPKLFYELWGGHRCFILQISWRLFVACSFS